MTERNRQAHVQTRPAGSVPAAQGRHALAVEIAPELISALPRNILAPELEIRALPLSDLDQEPLTGPQAPALILSYLVTPVFDALDLARLLSDHGYRGRYLALCEHLPNPMLIRREVTAQSPGVNFDVIILDGTTPLHSL